MMIELLYLTASVLFMFGLKMMSRVETARRGNLLSAGAMGLAIGTTLLQGSVTDWRPILAGVAVGTVVGGVFAIRAKMTAMPQLVALFNGFGGAGSLLVAAAELARVGGSKSLIALIAIPLSTIVGGITFTGSVVAFAKLQELISGKPTIFKGQHWLNLFLLLLSVAIGIYVVRVPQVSVPFIILNVIALILGVMAVIPIGGADMPVVISLLNSYSGIAVATTGFVLSNNLLIIVGSLVGASGLILTNIMCQAMNRSLTNVLFAGFGSTTASATAASSTTATQGINEGTVENAATVLENARSLIVVPGYGMAVAQAQKVIRELSDLLEQRGATVKYAIHPVAGRMPGHMNVLLAEAQVPYDQLYDLDAINDEFSTTDVTLIVGANDVVNPAAKNNPKSPIYGMPVLNVDQSRAIIVLKRSMNPGFAGIENELFLHPNTMMVFGDAKKTLTQIVGSLKA